MTRLALAALLLASPAMAGERHIVRVEVGHAGESALGALNAAGLACKMTFGGEVVVITWDTGPPDFYLTSDGAAIVLPGDGVCTGGGAVIHAGAGAGSQTVTFGVETKP